MSALSDLKDRIIAKIYQNTQQKVTGQAMQDSLLDMIDTMGVSVSQNTSTGHTDITVGSTTTPVASVEEVSQLGQDVGRLQDDVFGEPHYYDYEILQDSFPLDCLKVGNIIEIKIISSQTATPRVLFATQIGSTTKEILGEISDINTAHLYNISINAEKLYFYNQNGAESLSFSVRQISIDDYIKKSSLIRLGISKINLINNIECAFMNDNNSQISLDLLSTSKALVKIPEQITELQVSDFNLGTGVTVQDNKLVFNNVSYLIGAGYIGELIRGRKYKVSFTIRNLIKGKVTVYNGSTAVADKTFVVPGTFNVTFVAVHENLHIVSGISNSSFDLQEVSITELSLYEYDNVNTILEKTPTASEPSCTNGDDSVAFNETPTWYGITKDNIMTIGNKYLIEFNVSQYSAGKIGLRNGDVWELEGDRDGYFSKVFTAATKNLSLLSSSGTGTFTVKNVRLYEITSSNWVKNEDDLLLSEFDNIFVGYSMNEPYYIKKMVITNEKPSFEDAQYINSAIGAKAILGECFNNFGVLNNNITL